MPACAKPEPFYVPWRRSLVHLVFAGICGVSAISALASSGFKVNAIQARAGDQALRVGGAVELVLTQAVEEAISNGIPIELVIDIRLHRERPIIWDERVASWRLRRELRYHALTGQYLVNAGTGAPVARESFTSLNQALNEMGALDELALPLRAPLAADAVHYLQLRANLDVEALPALLRPVAYTSRAWKLDTGWTRWKVQP